MANVTITIPGVGKVTATNAATEDTLLKILEAINKTGVGGAGAGAAGNQAVAESTAEVAASNKAASVVMQRLTTFGTALGVSFANLGKTAVALGAQMLTAYDAMARDPIGAAAGMINTAIDAVGNFASGVGSAIPVIGGLVSAAAEAAAALAKMANDIFAAEFKKSVDALNSYTKAGASFAGGMTEMRNLANDAGYSLETLSKAAAASREQLRESGLSQGEAVSVLAAGMGAAAKNVGKSGNSLRNEMLALGYNYEEQGEIMADYMAQQRAAGINLKNVAPAELAERTRQYATNLKVISDITGQDAKKAMQKARDQAMQAGVYATLMKKGGQQAVDKFIAASATMPEEMQKMLVQQLTLGSVVDAASAVWLQGNKKGAEQLSNMTSDIYDAGVSTEEAIRRTGVYSEQTGKYSLEHAENMAEIGQASIAGASGLVAETAELDQKMRIQGRKRQEGTTDASIIAARRQAMATDKTTQGFINLTQQTETFRAQMEKLIGNNLPVYAQLLANAHKEAVDAMNQFLDGTVEARNAFDQLIQDLRTLGISGVIEKYAKIAWEKITAFTSTHMKESLAVAAGLAGILIAKKFGGQILGATGRGVGRALGIGGKAASVAGSGAEAALNLPAAGGTGISGIETFLKGLAKGLAAFANPAAIAGLAAVTAGIIGFAAALRVAAPAFEPIGKALKSMLEGIGAIVKEVGPVLSNIIVGLGVSIKTVIDSISNFVPKLVPVIETVGSSIANIISNIGGAVSSTISSIGSGIENVASGISDIINSIGGSVSSVVSSIGQLIFDTGASISGIIDSIGSSINTVLGGISTTVTSVSTGLSGVIATIQESIVSVIDALTKSITDLSKISGSDLLGVAGGVSAIGVALVPFAAGGALAGLIAKAGGFKNITDGLHEFEGLDATKLTTVAEAMSKVKESMPSVAQLTAAAATGFFDKFTDEEEGTATASTVDTAKISDSSDVFVQIVDHLQHQISQQQEMIAYLRDQKDISFKILQATN